MHAFARRLAFLGVAVAAGCASRQAASPAALPARADDPLIERRVQLQCDDGTFRDGGVERLRQSVMDYLAVHRISGFTSDQEGRLVSVTMEPMYATGVEPPAEGALFRSMSITRDGVVVGYELATELPACSLVQTTNPDGTITRTCRRNACTRPSVCTLTTIIDPGGGPTVYSRDCYDPR